MKRTVALLALLTLAVPSADADSPCGDYIRQLDLLTLGDTAYNIAWAGDNIAVAAANAGLVVVDPSNPSELVVLGSEDAVQAIFVAIDGNTAYITNSAPGTFAAIDISDPSAPQLIAQRATQDYAHSLAIVGDYAYVLVGAEFGSVVYGIQRFDISDPSNPQDLGMWSTDYAGSIAYDAGYLYVGFASSLHVYDASDPLTPTPMGTVSVREAMDIYPDGDLLYVASTRPLEGDELLTIDVTDPSHPVIVHDILYGGSAYGRKNVARFENSLVVTLGTMMEFLDLSDPATPTPEFRFTGPGHRFEFDDQTMFMLYGDGIRTYDLTSPLMPELAAIVPEGEGVLKGGDFEISGDYAFVNDSDTLKIVDISTPTEPVIIGAAPTLGSIQATAIEGASAHVGHSSSTHASITIFDVSTPALPTELGSVDMPSAPRGIAAHGDLLYVAQLGTSLAIVDVSDPAAGLVISSTPLEGLNATGVAYADGVAYVATGIQITMIDVSDPAAPVVGAVYSSPTSGLREILVQDDIAYVWGEDLHILDVADPFNPELLAHFQVPGLELGYGGALRDGHLFIAARLGAVIIDVRDPANPYLVTQGIGRWQTTDIAATADYIFVSTSEGLQIYPMNCQSSVAVMVSGLFAQAADDRVHVRWSSPDQDASAFRLEAHHHNQTTQLPFEQIADGEYSATDPVRGRSGRVDYTVLHREGGSWTPAGETWLDLGTPTRPHIVGVAPNPFNPRTTVEFVLDHRGPARVSVYDVRGTRVCVVSDEVREPGLHAVNWNGRDESGALVASGAYFLRLETTDAVDQAKVLLLK